MIEWKRRDAFVGVFDILGFTSLIRQTDQEFPRAMLMGQLDDLLGTLDDQDVIRYGQVECMVFSDTIVVFAPDLDGGNPLRSYGWFSLLCTRLITRSVEIRLPLRGAISVGTAFTSASPPIILGPSFLEAHRYCEDQDWIGLLLTPSATLEFLRVGFDPIRADFVSDDIPLRKCPSKNVMAYRFRDGMSDYPGLLLLPLLHGMRDSAPDDAKEKYTRTIGFIERQGKMQKKGQSWLSSTSVYVLYLTIFGLAFVGNTVAMLFGHTPPKGINGWGLSFWCGVTAAVIARRKGKSGWLWFFIGLIPIGFGFYFVLVFLRALLFHH